MLLTFVLPVSKLYRTAPRIEFGSDKIYTRDFEEILVDLGNFVICSEGLVASRGMKASSM